MAYSLRGFAKMLADRIRVDAYSLALRAAITPDCRVLEIGTGTGYFALLAAALGARHVYAIEPDETIDIARELANVNGLSGAIEFMRADSRNVTLPLPADVIFSDLRGV